eukprot:UN04271
MSMNKLMLFLDVDHTLLHATKSPRAKAHTNHPILKQSIHEIEFPNPNNCPYYVKLRPGVESFLQTAAESIILFCIPWGTKRTPKSCGGSWTRRGIISVRSSLVRSTSIGAEKEGKSLYKKR